MLRHISSRDDDLSVRHTIVLEENNLKEIVDALVIINAISDGINKLNESLGISVARGSLTTNEDNAGYEFGSSLRFRSAQDVEIPEYHREDVHVLALVLMNTLHHHVVHGVKTDVNSLGLLDVLLERPLILLFNSHELADKLRVSSLTDDLLNHSHISDPVIFVSDSIRDELGEARVAAIKPASWGHTISHV